MELWDVYDINGKKSGDGPGIIYCSSHLVFTNQYCITTWGN